MQIAACPLPSLPVMRFAGFVAAVLLFAGLATAAPSVPEGVRRLADIAYGLTGGRASFTMKKY